MHGLHRESLSQLCCGFRIQLRFSVWPLFGRITGRSHFACLRGWYVSSGFSGCAPSRSSIFLTTTCKKSRAFFSELAWLLKVFLPLFKHPVGNGDGKAKLSIKLEHWMHGGLLYRFFFLNTLSPLLFHLLTMIPHAAGFIKFLGKILSTAVIYKAEDWNYFIKEGMGVTTVGQHNM